MTTQTITRFDIFNRKGDEAEGTEDRETVRFFEKRKLIGEIDLDDVTRYGEDDFISVDFDAFIIKTPRTVAEALDYLGEEPADEDDDNGDDNGDDEDRGSIVPEKYRVRYGAPQNCGDEIALALTEFVTLPRAKKNEDGGLDRAKLRGVAEANGIADSLAAWEERGLNGGLLRMNTSNRLRGMGRRGERVEIGSQVWEAREVEKKVRKPRASKKTAAQKKG